MTSNDQSSDEFDFDSEEAPKSPLDKLFDHATLVVRSHASEMGKNDLLYLYARFKYATEGPCNVPKPGLFNFEAKSKWESWKSLGNQLSRDQCKQDYIERLDQCLPQWRQGFSAGSSSDDKGTFGMRMSVMAAPKADGKAQTCFDFCKEGNLTRLRECVIQVNDVDDSGMTMLMWACDRGHLDVVKYLIEHGADPNIQDGDGQSCLHFAVSCEHVDVVRFLLGLKGLNKNLEDSDGLKPIDLTSNKDIIQVFN